MINNAMIKDIKKYYVQDSSGLKNLMKTYIKMAKTIKKNPKICGLHFRQWVVVL
jgi:hypothetical protein